MIVSRHRHRPSTAAMRACSKVNPYELLGISSGASSSEAKSAYRTASLRWHPDRNPGLGPQRRLLVSSVRCGKECEDKMSEITKAERCF